jgi:hypothetical protein
MKQRTLALITLAWVAAFAGHATSAEIYKHIDSSGKVVFTDQPPDDVEAEQVQLGPVNTVPAAPRAAATAPVPTATVASKYSWLKVSLSVGASVTNPGGPVVVSAGTDIGLQPGHKVVFFQNGVEVASGPAMSVAIADISRGEHTFKAEIRDGAGKVLVTSNAATTQVHRAFTPPARVTPR